LRVDGDEPERMAARDGDPRDGAAGFPHTRLGLTVVPTPEDLLLGDARDVVRRLVRAREEVADRRGIVARGGAEHSGITSRSEQREARSGKREASSGRVTSS
jgi:hypothetical protein